VTAPTASLLDRWPRQRLLVVGLVAVAVVVVLGLVLVQRIGTTYRDGLDVAAESAALAAEGAAPIVAITDELVDFATVAEQGIDDTRQLLATAQVSLDQLGVAAQEDLAVTTAGLAGLADRVADVIESIERFIPGDRASAAEDLRVIADGLEPVPGELQALGTQLQTTATELDALDPTLADVASTVRELGDALGELAPSVDELATTAQRLEARVGDARDRVGVDLWIARLVVVLVGAVLAIGLLLAYRPPTPAEG
jgi:methyl-accepting chemotaxis protein